MLRPQGYLTVVDDRVAEFDSISCKHCQAIVVVKPGTGATVYLQSAVGTDGTIQTHEEAGAFCRHCMGAICLRCHARGRCVPFERWIERQEAKRRFLETALGI